MTLGTVMLKRQCRRQMAVKVFSVNLVILKKQDHVFLTRYKDLRYPMYNRVFLHSA